VWKTLPHRGTLCDFDEFTPVFTFGCPPPPAAHASVTLSFLQARELAPARAGLTLFRRVHRFTLSLSCSTLILDLINTAIRNHSI